MLSDVIFLAAPVANTAVTQSTASMSSDNDTTSSTAVPKHKCVDAFVHMAGDYMGVRKVLNQLSHMAISVAHLKTMPQKNKVYKGELHLNNGVRELQSGNGVIKR